MNLDDGPRRRFLRDIPEQPQPQQQRQQHRQFYRIMGLIVGVERNQDGAMLVLDDGTALAILPVTHGMLRRASDCSVLLGSCVDCVVVSTTTTTNTTQMLRVESLSFVTDPYAEALRWAEIALRGTDDCCFRDGLPRQEKLTASDLLDLIVYDAEQQQGFSEHDLAILTNLTVPVVETMVQELQLTGQIYRNPQGLLLPL